MAMAPVVLLGQLPARGHQDDRLAEQADLLAGVVDVVLTGDRVAGGLEQLGDRVAGRGPPAGTDVQRAGRVGGHELDVDVSHARRSGTWLWP
jgi:hypothetical protein